MSNPYTLVFGQPPLENIERTAQDFLAFFMRKEYYNIKVITNYN